MTTPHDLLIFGGAARTGLALAEHARRHGLRVACFVRPGRDTAALDALGVTVLRGDAFSPDDCRAALDAAAPRAVVSLLGGKDAQGRRVDADGNQNAIDAAQAWQADLRFLLISSMGCDEQYEALPAPIRGALGEALEAKTLAERHLRLSSLAWTILRPTGLKDGGASGRYRLSEPPEMVFSDYLSRSDAALAALDLIGQSSRVGQAVSVLPLADLPAAA